MQHDLRTATWRKSSYSGSDNGTCVEVADGFEGVVPVRDSKDASLPPLLIPNTAWDAFIEHVRP